MSIFNEPGAWLGVAFWLLSAVYLSGMALRWLWCKRRPVNKDHAWVRANVPGMGTASDADIAEWLADVIEDGEAALAIHERRK